ncbi:MAG: 5'/3'-nucleotidase SurE [Tepidisphaeraceae bacterium]
MLILLTNDDGIRAPGLLAMYRELVRMGDVHVIAPEEAQSASAHGITVTAPLITSRVSVENGFTGTAVGGRPADCVKLAIAELLPAQPDLVISGINHGTNAGINVIYSGTVAAAIEAAFLGRPSIAVSLLLKDGVAVDYARTAAISVELIRRILDLGLPPAHVVNINIPALRPDEQPAGLRFVRQCTRPWVDTYEHRKDPRGRDYYWNSSVFSLAQSEADTDVASLGENFITITPLQFDLTDHATLERWRLLTK